MTVTANPLPVVRAGLVHPVGAALQPPQTREWEGNEFYPQSCALSAGGRRTSAQDHVPPTESEASPGSTGQNQTPLRTQQRWNTKFSLGQRPDERPCGVETEVGGQQAHLARPSNCRVEELLGRVGALPKRRRRGCLGCRRLTRPSLAGSQSRLGTSSWLGSRQHSSTKPSSGSLAGPSSRPVGRGRRSLH